MAAALDSTGTAESMLSLSDTGSYIDIDNVAPGILLSLNTSNPIETQEVIVNLDISDSTSIETVVLHWSTGSDNSFTWDTVDTTSLQYSIGQFQPLDTLSVWAFATDSIGNIGESEELTVIVSPEDITAPTQPSGSKYVLPSSSYSFSSDSSISNLGSPLEYRFDWGDSTYSDWGINNRSHSWLSNGYFLVSAQTRSIVDTTHKSAWSDPLAVWVDSDVPTVNILTNNGSDFSWSEDFVIVEGMTSDIGSGVDSVFTSAGLMNNGNVSNFGFKVPLGSVGSSTPITITAKDKVGNEGSASMNITRVAAEFTIAGTAFTLGPDTTQYGFCATYDPSAGMWRNGIPNKTAFIVLGDSISFLADTKTDSCGYYEFAIPKGDFYFGMLNDYDNTILYHFTSAYFDSLANLGIYEVTGVNFDFGDDSTGIPTDIEDEENLNLPEVYYLGQNYPNPFNPITHIEFALPRSSDVRIDIFNILGERVKSVVNRRMAAGNHSVTWNGTNDGGGAVASGVYFYRISTDGYTAAKKMILLK